jgi:dihydrofolate synthase / folylpolyglutamate synthase
LDATNVLQPLVSVITSISLEHTHILGGTLKEIAAEKAGIIKQGIPCVTAVTPHAAVSVIKHTAKNNASPLRQINPSDISIVKSSINGLEVEFKKTELRKKRMKISLAGRHQAVNAAVALEVIRVLQQSGTFEVDESDVVKALAHIQLYSGLNARLAVIQQNPLIIADVAHNPEAVKTLCGALKQMGMDRCHVVIGLMQDKEHGVILREIRNIATDVFLVQARTERSRSIEDLAVQCKKLKIPYVEHLSVREGIKAVLARNDKIPILITGSHFVVGEALASLQRKKYLTINQ